MDAALWSDVFHKDFVNKLCIILENFLPNKTVEKRERNFRNLGNEEYPCHELKASQID